MVATANWRQELLKEDLEAAEEESCSRSRRLKDMVYAKELRAQPISKRVSRVRSSEANRPRTVALVPFIQGFHPRGVRPAWSRFPEVLDLGMVMYAHGTVMYPIIAYTVHITYLI